jgi:hypothetical protein
VAQFAAALTGGPLPEGVTATAPDEAARRFDVYRNNVAVSLTAALAQRFPVIERLVGTAFFAAMARVYAETHRPSSPVLLEWGESFPAFLAGFPPLSGYPYMADVARIELARGRAFHAADAAPARPEALAGQDVARLVLRLHPSVQVLRLDHPAVTIWARNQPGATPGPLERTGPEIALVLRTPGFAVPVQAIGPGDAAMIEEIGRGTPLTVAAEAAQWAEPGHDPGAALLRLIGSGALCEPAPA